LGIRNSDERGDNIPFVNSEPGIWPAILERILRDMRRRK